MAILIVSLRSDDLSAFLGEREAHKAFVFVRKCCLGCTGFTVEKQGYLKMAKQLEIVVSSRNGHSRTECYDLVDGLTPEACAGYLSKRLYSEPSSHEVIVQVGDVSKIKMTIQGESEEDAVRIATARSFFRMNDLLHRNEQDRSYFERWLYQLAKDSRIAQRNPPSREVLWKEDNQKRYEELVEHPDWIHIGMIPVPKSRLGWFVYNMLHGLAMRYPLRAVIAYSLLHVRK